MGDGPDGLNHYICPKHLNALTIIVQRRACAGNRLRSHESSEFTNPFGAEIEILFSRNQGGISFLNKEIGDIVRWNHKKTIRRRRESLGMRVRPDPLLDRKFGV